MRDEGIETKKAAALACRSHARRNLTPVRGLRKQTGGRMLIVLAVKNHGPFRAPLTSFKRLNWRHYDRSMTVDRTRGFGRHKKRQRERVSKKIDGGGESD